MKRNLKPLFFVIPLIFIIILSNRYNNKLDSDENIETQSPDESVFVWNNANNTKNINTLAQMYDSIVHFYQHIYTADECIKSKSAYFEEYPDFKQEIEGRLFIDTLKDGIVKVNFTKTVTINNKEEKFPAYLIFKKHQKRWKIYVESDLYTDRELSTGAQIKNDAVQGDFNGDGIMDYMWIETPQNAGDEYKIRFSGPIVPIILTDFSGGTLINAGDLDGDGADEVGILPLWTTDCPTDCVVYTFKGYQWTSPLSPQSGEQTGK
ncbi:MAG: VCBS repeat-containing protein [Prevotellaceae bacterium]|jgi:hypothetical protein|nr:VCBS repeat-containing protein [Prevotellaceae bacterium]